MTTINKLRIANFKSIKNVDLDCKRINVLIGEPNTGKSNILESLGLMSHLCYGTISRFVRYESLIDLFYDHNMDEPIELVFDDARLRITFGHGRFRGELELLPSNRHLEMFSYGYGVEGRGVQSFSGDLSFLNSFKFYRFQILSNFPEPMSDFLLPPDGRNLLHVILTRKDLRKILTDLFKKFGYRLVFKPPESKIEVQKEMEDIIVSFPYALASETLQRIAFHLAAIYSNENSIISFEEPEAHAFPYYMKFLAEKIALDRMKNQYFIATHNPYFLFSIMEKTPKDEIATFITYMKDYQTKIKALSESDIEQALEMGSDLFLNINQFLGKGLNKGN